MAFDWRNFLDRHGIRYSIGNPHGAGYIGVRCPFCGNAGTDPTRHRMGINPHGRGWRCLRDDNHAGISPVRLVAALINCSTEEARHICGIDGDPLPMSIDAIERTMNEVMNGTPQAQITKPKALHFTGDIYPIPERASNLFHRYLLKRDYSNAEAFDVAKRYGLRCAITGPYAYRLVFPIETTDGLVTWTGRGIAESMVPRYKTLSTDAEKAKRENLPAATANIKHCLWNERELVNASGDLLVAVEGPFDALRVDYYGRDHGIRATALFNKTLSKRQLLTLPNLGRFKRRALLLDTDATIDAYVQTSNADYAGLDVIRMPTKAKDPAMLTRDEVRSLLSS